MLEMLKRKVYTLLCLLSEERSQSRQALKTAKSIYTNRTYIFYIDKILKALKPGNIRKPLEYRQYPNNIEILYVATRLKEYISRTELIRENLNGNNEQLILSYPYPHKPINSQSITWYIKLFLELCGIDVSVYCTFSKRCLNK